MSWVGSVLCRYLHNLSAEELDDVDHDLSRGCEKDLYDLYDLLPLHDLDLPGRADLFPILYDLLHLIHVAGSKPYHLHYLDIARVSWVGFVLQYTHPVLHLIPASYGL